MIMMLHDFTSYHIHMKAIIRISYEEYTGNYLHVSQRCSTYTSLGVIFDKNYPHMLQQAYIASILRKYIHFSVIFMNGKCSCGFFFTSNYKSLNMKETKSESQIQKNVTLDIKKPLRIPGNFHTIHLLHNSLPEKSNLEFTNIDETFIRVIFYEFTAFCFGGL